MTQQKLKIKCSDGIELSAILLMPDGQPKAVVQSATLKEYYLPFASYLVENGFVACVFDYHGVCESTPEDGLRGCKYDYVMFGQSEKLRRFYKMTRGTDWVKSVILPNFIVT
jgi:predicted alpha/beta hydrolase